MQLSVPAFQAILTKVKIRARLMILFDCSEKTILRWVEIKDIKLTTASALEIIQEESGLKKNQLLVEDKAKA
jgi:hypothetical protein